MDMDGNVLYHKMVEEVQFLELMLDSQNGNLTRPPPKRMHSAPVLDVMLDSDFGDENILKSCPAFVSQDCTIKEASEGSLKDLKDDKDGHMVADSPAIPDIRRQGFIAPSPPIDSVKNDLISDNVLYNKVVFGFITDFLQSKKSCIYVW